MTRLDSYRKTKLLLCSCLLAGAAAVACQKEMSSSMQSARVNSHELPIQWSPALHLNSLPDITQRLNQPFLEPFTGTVAGESAVISNCNDYFRLSKLGFKRSSDRENRILRFNTIDCVAINLLKTAKPARSTYLSGFRLTPAAINVLPPELAPTISREQETDAQAAGAAGKSWRTYVKNAQVTAGDTVSQIVVTEPSWSTKVTEYGRADFTGDGVEDLLVRTDTSATKGTATNEQLFILGRKSNFGRLTLEQAVTIP